MVNAVHENLGTKEESKEWFSKKYWRKGRFSKIRGVVSRLKICLKKKKLYLLRYLVLWKFLLYKKKY